MNVLKFAGGNTFRLAAKPVSNEYFSVVVLMSLSPSFSDNCSSLLISAGMAWVDAGGGPLCL